MKLFCACLLLVAMLAGTSASTLAGQDQQTAPAPATATAADTAANADSPQSLDEWTACYQRKYDAAQRAWSAVVRDPAAWEAFWTAKDADPVGHLEHGLVVATCSNGAITSINQERPPRMQVAVDALASWLDAKGYALLGRLLSDQALSPADEPYRPLLEALAMDYGITMQSSQLQGMPVLGREHPTPQAILDQSNAWVKRVHARTVDIINRVSGKTPLTREDMLWMRRAALLLRADGGNGSATMRPTYEFKDVYGKVAPPMACALLDDVLASPRYHDETTDPFLPFDDAQTYLALVDINLAGQHFAGPTHDVLAQARGKRPVVLILVAALDEGCTPEYLSQYEATVQAYRDVCDFYFVSCGLFTDVKQVNWNFFGQPLDLTRPGSIGPDYPDEPATIEEKGRCLKNLFMARPALTTPVLVDDLGLSTTYHLQLGDMFGGFQSYILFDSDGRLASEPMQFWSYELGSEDYHLLLEQQLRILLANGGKMPDPRHTTGFAPCTLEWSNIIERWEFRNPKGWSDFCPYGDYADIQSVHASEGYLIVNYQGKTARLTLRPTGVLVDMRDFSPMRFEDFRAGEQIRITRGSFMPDGGIQAFVISPYRVIPGDSTDCAAHLHAYGTITAVDPERRTVTIHRDPLKERRIGLKFWDEAGPRAAVFGQRELADWIRPALYNLPNFAWVKEWWTTPEQDLRMLRDYLADVARDPTVTLALKDASFVTLDGVGSALGDLRPGDRAVYTISDATPDHDWTPVLCASRIPQAWLDHTVVPVAIPDGPAHPAYAFKDGTCHVTWNADPRATGYLVSYGTDHSSYGTSLRVGAQTSADLVGLDPSAVYFLIVQAEYPDHSLSLGSNELRLARRSSDPAVAIDFADQPADAARQFQELTMGDFHFSKQGNGALYIVPGQHDAAKHEIALTGWGSRLCLDRKDGRSFDLAALELRQSHPGTSAIITATDVAGQTLTRIVDFPDSTANVPVQLDWLEIAHLEIVYSNNRDGNCTTPFEGGLAKILINQPAM